MTRPKLTIVLYLIAAALAFVAVSVRYARRGDVDFRWAAAGLALAAIGGTAWRRSALQNRPH